jgi:hypothetical protein
MKRYSKLFSRAAGLALCALLLVPNAALLAQQPPPEAPPPSQTLTPDQLNDLVAPIALYPDPLLSQVLVAATYPLEVVQAYQWLQKTPGLTGTALTEAAAQQNWDPSIQALVVLPDVLKRLNDDVSWTTNLGNAFLAQQSDVMDAVQRMRAKAQQVGALASSPQETVSTVDQGGQPYIDIEPADPEIIYVPTYDPVWIWGAPVWYPYPRWYWPPRPVGGLFISWGGGISIGGFFGGGWGGWAGWGWHPAWGSHTVIVNNTFIHRYNFNTVNSTTVRGNTTWQHDPVHRAGVPYSTPALTQQYRGNVRQNVAPQAMPRGGSAPTEQMGNRQVPANTTPARNGSAFGNVNEGSNSRVMSDHGRASMGPSRTQSAPPARSGGGGGGGGGARSAPPARGGGRGGR